MHINRDLSGPAPCRDCAGHVWKISCPQRFFPKHPQTTSAIAQEREVDVTLNTWLAFFICNRFESIQHPPRLHRHCGLAGGTPCASTYTYRKTLVSLSIATITQRLWFSGKIQASHTLLGWSGHSREYCLGPGFDSRWAQIFVTRRFNFIRMGTILRCLI